MLHSSLSQQQRHAKASQKHTAGLQLRKAMKSQQHMWLCVVRTPGVTSEEGAAAATTHLDVFHHA
jgi:hypothetical protein